MSKDRRARDILGELSSRKRLGDRLLERVGRRGWDRPNVSVSARLFARFGIADPWDPNTSRKKVRPIGLGPVSLRLGEDRRQPAPHLRPKQPKKKKGGPRLPNVPRASSSGSSPPSGGGPRFPPGFKPPVGVPKASQSAGWKPPPPPPRPTTEVSREFGGGTQKRGLVGALPVRPEIAARMKADAAAKAAGTPPPKAVPLPKPVRPARPAPPPKTSRKPRVMSRNPNLPPPGAEGAPVDRRPPMPARPQKKRRGRFSMQSTPVTNAPIVTDVPEPAAEAPAPAPAPAPVPAPRPTAPVMAGGLDDLFGFAAQEGRMRFGSKKDKKS